MEGDTKPQIEETTETKVEISQEKELPMDSPAIVYEDSDPKLQEEEKVLLKELKHHHHHHSSLKGYTDSELGATFNLVNATVGSGILGLPFVLRETGLILGVGFIFIGAAISMISLSMLRIAHKMMLEREPQAKDYEDMGYYLYGSFISLIVKIAVILINFGGTVSYIIILGKTTSEVWKNLLGPNHLLSTNIWIASAVIVIPVTFLSMLKKMSDIRWISYASLSFVFAFVIFLIVGFGMNILGKREGKVELASLNISMLRVLGIITFSFGSHTNLCSIHSEFRVKDSVKVGRAIVSNIVIDFIIYSLCGVFGYLSFLKNTKGNLLESLDLSKWWNLLFTIIFCLTIFFTFPMTVFPTRLSLDNVFKSLWSPFFKPNQAKPQWFEKSSQLDWFHGLLWKHFENVRLVVETCAIMGLAYIFAIAIPEVDFVFSVTGSTASACTSYIFPAMFYLKLTRKPWYHWSCVLCIALFLFGLIFGLGITTISILTRVGVIVLPK